MAFKGFKPFKQRASTNIAYKAIPVPGMTTMYLLSLGYTTVNDALTDEDEKKLDEQLESQTLILETVRDIMEKEKVEYKEANNLLFGIKVKTIQTDEGAEVVASDESSEFAMFKYMGRERYKALLKAMAKKNKDRALVESVATGMIARRALYPVIVSKSAREGADTLIVEPLAFPMAKGDKAQFGDVVVTLSANAECDATTLKLTDEISTRIKHNTVGFALDSNGVVIAGYDGWSLELTKSELPNAPIDVAQEIYEFYMSERGMKTDGDAGALDEEMDLGKSNPLLTDSETVENESVSTTVNSTGKSSTTESQTPDSTPKTLEVSLSG
ncbi:MAG: hypothetical protein KME47_09375 [Nodosilinea sp. WJT8-NPBG4]|jgi:hypothetical protein|nr:hypothetical protein [Nodosilinea sp. WJT8-NPBG4]